MPRLQGLGLAEKIEPLEREEAKKRQKNHGGTAPGKPKNTSGKLPEVKSDSRDKVGAAVGLSGKTYEKAKAVVQAAGADQVPDQHDLGDV